MRSTLNCSAACSSGQCTIDPGLSTQDGIQLLQQLCRLQVDIAPEADDISPVLLGVMGILLSCGILLALFFLLFTIRFKNNRIVKMSSPNLNIVTIIGSILTYGSGYMFGLMEGRTVTAEISTKLIIQIRIWTLCIGTSLIFGPILGKSWRLYKVFTQRIPEKRVIIKDVQLLGLVAGVIGVDVLVLVTWGFADPLECTQSINAAIRAIEKDLSYSVTTIKWCSSHYTDIWIILISLLKGSLLLYGTYLAGLTSNVSSPPVNQTTTIMVGVYVVMFTAGIITPITRFLDSWPNLTYGVTTAGIFVCTSTINCLIFIPQVRQWKKFDEELNHVPNQMSKYLNSPSKTFRSMYSDEQIYHLLGENNSMKRLLTERNATIECLQEQVNNVKERLMYLMEPEYIDELRNDIPASQPSTACSPVINSALMCPNTTTGGPLEEEPLSDVLNNQDHSSGSQHDIQAVSLQSHLGQIGYDTKISPETVLHSQEGIEVFKDSGCFYRDSENYPNSETVTGSFQKALDALEITLEIPSNLDNRVKIVQDPSSEMLTSSSARPAVVTGADAKPSIGDPIKEMKSKFVNSEKLQEILQELNVNAVNTTYSPNKARRILPTGNLGQYSGTAEWVKHHCHNISPYMMRRRRPPFYSIRRVPPPYYILHSTHQHAKYINKESNRDTINALPTDHTQLQRTHRQLLPESSSLLRLPSVENIQMHLNAWQTPQKTEQRDGHAHSLTSGGDCIIKSHSDLKTDLPSKGIQMAGAEGSSEIYQYDYSDSESDSSDEMFCYYHRSYCEVCCEDSCNSSISETSDSEVYNAPFHWSQKHLYSHPTVNFKEDLKPTFV